MTSGILGWLCGALIRVRDGDELGSYTGSFLDRSDDRGWLVSDGA